MKEFSFTYQDGLNKGLRPDSKVPRNSPYLYDAYNVKIGRVGCQPFVPLSTDITAPDTAGYRTPQLFAAKAGMYCGTKQGLYRVDFDLDIGTKICDNTFHASDDTHWSLADFGHFQMWCSDGPLYYMDIEAGEDVATQFGGGAYDTPIVISEHLAKANPWFSMIADLNGRFFANIQLYIFDPEPGDFVPYWWYKQRAKIAWSRPGDVSVGVLNKMIEMISGGADSYNPYVPEGYGNIQMPWFGTVAAMKQLGNNMIIYGKSDYNPPFPESAEYPRSRGGVTAMVQHISPTPTFGLVPIHDIGVAAGRPVAGNKDRHVFVDADGVVWSLTADLKKERLGYEEFTYPMMLAPNLYVYVSHDPVNDDYYITIGNHEYALLLAPGGMSRIFQKVMSIVECTSYPDGTQVRSVQCIVKALPGGGV